jgi:short subunit dehydrogenase-like uncharacterized protein
LKDKNWLLYGAYGYTGELIAREALLRGHKPVIAGRSKEKLATLAESLDLEYQVFDLKDSKLEKTISEFDLVFHAAGPYIYTSAPMVEACLKTGTNYLDITGEIPVLENHFKLDEDFRQKEIALIPAVGFDVVPSDCLGKYVSEKIDNPTHLEIAFTMEGGISPGTLKTMLTHISKGILTRKNGELVKLPHGTKSLEVRFPDKIRKVVPTQWADIITSYISTEIPNITDYIAPPKKTLELMSAVNSVDGDVQEWIERNVKGPDEKTRTTAQSYLWARVSNDQGEEAEAWLETMDGYQLTAVAGVRSVEKVFKLRPKGALTPALAFGKDFILELPNSQMFESLETVTY